MEGGPHTTVNLFVRGSHVILQPSAEKAPMLETASIDLRSGSIELLSQPPVQSQSTHVLGVLGVCKLYTGVCVVGITAAKIVAKIGEHDVFEVESCDLVYDASSGKRPDNAALLDLLRDAVDPRRSGRGLYFSYHHELTLSLQKAAAAPLGLPATRADPRFFWNRAAARPLMEAGAHRFVLPMILGFVSQTSAVLGRASTSATLTVVARRGVQRAGTRHWRRGADKEGNVANFVETEQIVSLETPSGNTVSSFVQVRGSIPLLWTQIPNIKYKPTTLMAPSSESGSAFEKHVRNLVEQYKKVIAIDLVNQSGSEGKLESAFRAESQRVAPSLPGYRYVAFDFHHMCSKSRYHNVSLLWDQISSDARDYGFYCSRGGSVTSTQGGVLRTNCIDCLDRTNVVQGVLARKALEAQLQQANVMGATVTLPEAFPELEKKFKILWADHGDAISMQYAGTGAMKSAFTRTGKRDFAGVIDDGIKALARYYLNNFQDGRKQDAVDLITGTYSPQERGSSPIRPQRSPLLPIVVALAALLYSVRNTFLVTSSALLSAPARAVQQQQPPGFLLHVLLPLIVAFGLLHLVMRNGKFLVNRPQLCPQLAHTVMRGK